MFGNDGSELEDGRTRRSVGIHRQIECSRGSRPDHERQASNLERMINRWISVAGTLGR